MKDLDMELMNSVWVPVERSKTTKLAGLRAFGVSAGVKTACRGPYSPNLRLCDRFLFIWLQQKCRREEYADGNKLHRDVQRLLGRPPKD